MNTQSKKIGIDARFYGPLGKGLGRYTQEVVDNLLAQDRDNEYVIFLSKENFDELQSDNPRLKKVLAEVRWYTLREQLVMPRLIAKENLDLMHFPHFNVPFFCSCPFVVTIHDLILTRFPTMRASTLGPILYFIKNFFYKVVISRAIRKSKRVIAVSEYTKKDILEHFKIKPEKISVTLEGVATLSGNADKVFSRSLAPEQTLSNYCILEPYLLYVGNAYPHKNLETLMRVFKMVQEKLPDMKLVLVGKSDYFYERLKSHAQELGSDGIIFPGYVPDKDLEVLFQHASLYVFPSKYEGFGLPPLEAMSRDCPVASSNATCLPEILGDSAAYFDPSNESEMTRVIVETATNQTLRQELIAKGRERITLYDWARCAQQTKEVYERVLS